MNGNKELVQSIIHMHETDNFQALTSHILESELEAGTWFTEKRFTEVCKAIKDEPGSITSLEYIDTLNRRSSYLTLWKATYTKSKDEVLWQIIFDTATNKIKLMHINWESA